MNSNSYTSEALYCQHKPPPENKHPAHATIAHVMSRLDEKQSTILLLDLAWDCKDLSDTDRRNAVRDVRRALIDAIEDLSRCLPAH